MLSWPVFHVSPGCLEQNEVTLFIVYTYLLPPIFKARPSPNGGLTPSHVSILVAFQHGPGCLNGALGFEQVGYPQIFYHTNCHWVFALLTDLTSAQHS
ncbi:hypothetical protein AVEN_55393-1 [Araneus ventricosus]|uniref:Uncharacterized protein n=1 Tax=Araneus ventricosus TaxID=182803 RepID=A0A4Y2RLA9_ARAVE|nr:hypothetical protein AVEN_55393-1 [Araneus ventricosus]